MHLADFEAKRKELNPQRIERVTPELGQLLAVRITSAVLGMDDKVRADPGAAKMLLGALKAAVPSGLTIGAPAPVPPSWLDAPVDPLEGLSEGLAGELARLNGSLDQLAAMDMATQRIAAVLSMVQAEAKKLGLIFDAKTPGALDALRECLKAYRRARQDAARRDAGEVIETPPAPERAEPRQAHAAKLRHVYDLWKASKKRSSDTERACLLALQAFEEQSGNPDIRQITRAQGDAFRAHLLKKDLSSKTKHDRMTWVKSLLKYAYQDLELLNRNPWEGLDIDHSTENRRSPWSIAQMKAFAALPLFSRYELPSGWKAGGAAAYWVPLLALYTGARVGELCQLRVADIETDASGAFVKISGEAEGARVKTAAGWRTVPLHSELVRLGFLDYVRDTKKSGSDSLWPALRLRKGKPGGYFSGWYGEYRRDNGTITPDLHSLRHTVRSRLAHGKVASSTRDRITGHKVQGSVGTRVYEHVDTAELREAMESISYPGLELKRVYVAT